MNKFFKIINSAMKCYVDKKFRDVDIKLNEVKTSLPDWEEHDETSLSFIKNKTHYDSRVFTEAEEIINLTFNGYVYDKDYITVEYADTDDDTYLVKISDIPLTKKQLIGIAVKKTIPAIYADEQDVIENITLTEDLLNDNGSYISYDHEIFSILEGEVYYDPPYGSAPGGYMSKGIWVKSHHEYHYSSISGTITTTNVEGELKQLDPKYLPEGVFRYDEEQNLSETQLTQLHSNMQLNKYKFQELTLVDKVSGLEYIVSMVNGKIVYESLCTSIYVSQNPNQKIYGTNDTFNPDGIVVCAYCEDGTVKDITSGCTFSNVDSNGKVIITYIESGKEFTAIIHVETIDSLGDFYYNDNGDGTVTLTGWKGTLNSEPSTEMVFPNDPRVIL